MKLFRMRPFVVFAFLAALADGGAIAASCDADSAAVAARDALRSIVVAGDAPGAAAAVAIDGRVVWAEASGYADASQGILAQPSTLFGIGSVTKSLTTVLLGRLADRGLVSFDEPVERYLPDFPHRGKGITLRMIAGHVSGLSDAFNGRNRYATTHYETTADALAEIYNEKLVHEPGTASLYSTGSYTILAGIIERVTGQTFTEAMREYVLAPLGMDDTLPNDPRSEFRRRSVFYERDAAGRVEPARYSDPSFKMAGAGYLSTASDLAVFGSALTEPGFLSEQALQKLFTPVSTTDGTKTVFGLGWRVGPDAGPGINWRIGPDDRDLGIVHQPGGGPGISSWIVILREARMAVVVLSNLTGAPVGGSRLDAMIDAFLPCAHRDDT